MKKVRARHFIMELFKTSEKEKMRHKTRGKENSYAQSEDKDGGGHRKTIER